MLRSRRGFQIKTIHEGHDKSSFEEVLQMVEDVQAAIRVAKEKGRNGRSFTECSARLRTGGCRE